MQTGQTSPPIRPADPREHANTVVATRQASTDRSECISVYLLPHNIRQADKHHVLGNWVNLRRHCRRVRRIRCTWIEEAHCGSGQDINLEHSCPLPGQRHVPNIRQAFHVITTSELNTSIAGPLGGAPPCHGCRSTEQGGGRSLRGRHDHVQRKHLPAGPRSAAVQGAGPRHPAWRTMLDCWMGSFGIRFQGTLAQDVMDAIFEGEPRWIICTVLSARPSSPSSAVSCSGQRAGQHRHRPAYLLP